MAQIVGKPTTFQSAGKLPKFVSLFRVFLNLWKTRQFCFRLCNANARWKARLQFNSLFNRFFSIHNFWSIKFVVKDKPIQMVSYIKLHNYLLNSIVKSDRCTPEMSDTLKVHGLGTLSRDLYLWVLKPAVELKWRTLQETRDLDSMPGHLPAQWT